MFKDLKAKYEAEAKLKISEQLTFSLKNENSELLKEVHQYRSISRYGKDWTTPQGLLKIKESLEDYEKLLIKREAEIKANEEVQKLKIQIEQNKIECLKEQVKLLKEVIKK